MEIHLTIGLLVAGILLLAGPKLWQLIETGISNGNQVRPSVNPTRSQLVVMLIQVRDHLKRHQQDHNVDSAIKVIDETVVPSVMCCCDNEADYA